MSTILKALKRLDDQRRSESSPRTLEEQVLAPGGVAPLRSTFLDRKGRLLVGGAVALLLVAGGGWLALRKAEAPAAASAPPRASAAPPQPVAALAPRGALPSPDAIGPTPQGEPARLGLSAPAAPIGSAPSEPPPRNDEPEGELAGTPGEPRPEAARPSVAPTRQGGRSSRSAAPAPAPAPASVEARAAAPTVAREQAAATPSEPPGRGPIPEPDTAPQVARAAPTMRVLRTQWHPTPDKRSALVRAADTAEARELREGDAIDGAVVKEIRPSGVVFLRDGGEFTQGVGAD